MGYSCTGTTCTKLCGNGVVDSVATPAYTEQCDDGGTTSGNGCSSTCTLEPGYACTGAPSICAIDCGDGLIYAPETCDDSNTVVNDGCSATC